jgi:hypothetical protein
MNDTAPVGYIHSGFKEDIKNLPSWQAIKSQLKAGYRRLRLSQLMRLKTWLLQVVLANFR